jgi:membrane protein
MGKDNLSALAAGAAFQALLSLFPTLTAVVSLYGLVADPNMVARQITAMQGVLPPEAVKLIPRGYKPLSKDRPNGLASASSLACCSPSGACGRQRGC